MRRTFELPGAAALRSLLSELTAGTARSEAEPARPEASRFYFIDGSKPAGARARCFGAPALRRACGAARFPDPAGAGQRPPLVWFDNAATTQKPQAVIDRLAHFYAARKLATSTAPRTSWRRAPPMPTRARASKVRRFLGAQLGRRRSSSCAAPPRRSTWWPRAGAARTSGAATRSSSPRSSTTPTSCPGSSWRSEKGAKLRVIPVDDSGQVLLEEYAAPAQRPHQAGGGHAGLQRAGHRDAGEGDRRAGAPRRRARAGRRRAGGRRTCACDVQALDADFFVFSRPQGLRADRHRRGLRQARDARATCRRGKAAAT